jgi:hypothetical protein
LPRYADGDPTEHLEFLAELEKYHRHPENIIDTPAQAVATLLREGLARCFGVPAAGAAGALVEPVQGCGDLEVTSRRWFEGVAGEDLPPVVPPPGPVYLAVNNRDNGGTAYIVRFDNEDAYRRWRTGLGDDPEPFGFQAECGLARAILSPEWALRILGK